MSHDILKQYGEWGIKLKIEKNDYSRMKRKVFLQLVLMIAVSGIAVLLLYNFLKGKIGIWTIGLLHNPEVIFMDEPLNGLDANAVIIVKEVIARLAKEGKTIFYCSHLMDVVEKIASRVILINQGTIIANGSVRELMEEAGVSSLEGLFTKLPQIKTVLLNPSSSISANTL